MDEIDKREIPAFYVGHSMYRAAHIETSPNSDLSVMDVRKMSEYAIDVLHISFLILLRWR